MSDYLRQTIMALVNTVSISIGLYEEFDLLYPPYFGSIAYLLGQVQVHWIGTVIIGTIS